MNIDLKSDKLSFQRRVFKRRFTKEETVEVIVPDAQPDVLRVLDTDGTPYLRGKDCEAGRVTVTGLTELTVLYVPESGAGVRRVNVEIPFSASAEGEAVTPDCLITAKLCLVACDARAVNSRKLLVRAEVAVEAALFLPETVYNTSPREREGVYYRTERMELALPAAVDEKTFIFTDEAHLPASAPAIGELLRAGVVLTVESVKPVGSRAVLKGNAVTSVLYESRDDGKLRRETFTTPFSQTVETQAPMEASDFEMSLCLTGVHISRGYMSDDGGETLNLEIHAVAQCVAYVKCAVESVTDVYSTAHPLTAQRDALPLEVLAGTESASETLRASVPLTTETAEVLNVSVKKASVSVLEGQEGPRLALVVSVSVIYAEPGGELLSASRRVELERPVPAGAEVDISLAPEVFTTLAGGSVEARIGVEIALLQRGTVTLERVESLELQEDTTLDLGDLPNITVTRAGRRSLWELARAHMSTEALIRQANGLEEGAEPESGSVLLIPRCG